MSEKVRGVAVGFALVDEKIVGGGALPEPTLAAAESYLQGRDDVYRTAGGSVANTMVAFDAYAGHQSRLFYTVGDDMRGGAFRNQTAPALGPGCISESGHTGFCIIQLDEYGEIADEITLYGVSKQVVVPCEERTNRQNGMVLSNFNTMRHPDVRDQVGELLRHTLTPQGIFAFRLSGAHEDLVSRETAVATVAELPRVPDVIFANCHELTNLAGRSDDEVMGNVFPDSRLLVATDGRNDVRIRWEGAVHTLPVIDSAKVIDTTGAGDQLMGAMLAYALERNYADWDIAHVMKTASLALAAAARIVRSRQSRFTPFRVSE